MKKFVYLYLGVFFLTGMSFSANAAYSITAERVYQYAKTNSRTLLERVKDDIDVVDSNGNTALCLSVLRKNKAAYTCKCRCYLF